MTMVEKKMRTLGLKGHPMYLSRSQLKEARERFPDAKITRAPVEPASMVQGYHSYVVTNYAEVANETI